MEAFFKPLAYGWHGPIFVDQGFLSHLGWGFAVTLLGYFFGGPRWPRLPATSSPGALRMPTSARPRSAPRPKARGPPTRS